MDPKKKPEAKVVAASVASAVTGLALWTLSTYAFGGTVPEPVAVAVATLAPGLVTFIAGYLAKHTTRPPE